MSYIFNINNLFYSLYLLERERERETQAYITLSKINTKPLSCKKTLSLLPAFITGIVPKITISGNTVLSILINQ